MQRSQENIHNIQKVWILTAASAQLNRKTRLRTREVHETEWVREFQNLATLSHRNGSFTVRSFSRISSPAHCLVDAQPLPTHCLMHEVVVLVQSCLYRSVLMRTACQLSLEILSSQKFHAHCQAATVKKCTGAPQQRARARTPGNTARSCLHGAVNHSLLLCFQCKSSRAECTLKLPQKSDWFVMLFVFHSIPANSHDPGSFGLAGAHFYQWPQYPAEKALQNPRSQVLVVEGWRLFLACMQQFAMFHSDNVAVGTPVGHHCWHSRVQRAHVPVSLSKAFAGLACVTNPI